MGVAKSPKSCTKRRATVSRFRIKLNLIEAPYTDLERMIIDWDPGRNICLEPCASRSDPCDRPRIKRTSERAFQTQGLLQLHRATHPILKCKKEDSIGSCFGNSACPQPLATERSHLEILQICTDVPLSGLYSTTTLPEAGSCIMLSLDSRGACCDKPPKRSLRGRKDGQSCVEHTACASCMPHQFAIHPTLLSSNLLFPAAQV